MDVRTRFAPSPTGSLHIGGVRTALYSYLVAKKNNGKFSLRIEDTDRQRLVEGSLEDIIETLKWLGLSFDGDPVFQSQRQKIYQEHAQKLLSKGTAYESDGAIYFKTIKSGKTSIVDLVGGRKIEFINLTQNDFVILKSDGFPTYHLAHVVDDHMMGTNPVIRGAEWISSIPKHVMLFNAFGWEIPSYAHLPIILGPDKSKLSKRHGAKPASDFRKDGFLPEALLNYMALLGWTPKNNQEIISVDEMIQMFGLSDVHIANPVFDITKLEWMNGEYLRRMSDNELTKRLQDYLVDLSAGALAKADHPAKDKIGPVVPLIKERIKKLSDFIPLTDFLWEKPEYDKTQFQKLNIKNRRGLFSRKLENQNNVMAKVLERFQNMQKPWNAQVFEQTFRKLAEDEKLSNVQIFQLIRIAISGQTVTPPLFESIQILGEQESINRIREAMRFLEDVI